MSCFIADTEMRCYSNNSESMSALSTSFCGVKFTNPVILPSGIAQEIPRDHVRFVTAGIGGITTKSLTVEPREGNPIPRVAKFTHGFLNSVGLRGPGVEKGTPLIAEFIKSSPIPVIVSVFATNLPDFENLIKNIIPLDPPFIELNLSCPNVHDDMGAPLGMGSSSAARVVEMAKKMCTHIPVLAKLSPNVPNIGEIAKACETAGADGIVAINTVGPGMIIDIRKRKPVLGAKTGGVSGPGVLPIAVRCVYEIYEHVRIPIIGMGGISSGSDAIQMMMAGATLIGVGSSYYFNGLQIFEKIKKEISEYIKNDNIKDIKELVGTAHKS